MRHRSHTFKVGRTVSHRRCMIANMLKALILNGRIETTVTKAKELRRHADRMVTLAKKDTLASRRMAVARLMVRYNALTSKDARLLKNKQDTSVENGDRLVVNVLFGELGPRFKERQGGYTRIMRTAPSVGDNAPRCLIEYLAN
jgi:large subunit ribosomal protein L17